MIWVIVIMVVLLLMAFDVEIDGFLDGVLEAYRDWRRGKL